MQRAYYKRIIGIITLFISVVLIALFMQSTVANSDNADYRNLRCFYMEEPDSLDVVIMGASEVVNGYSAAEAYRATGFTSYPFAFSVNSVLLWKYELNEIEKRQHPKLLIVETNGAVYLSEKQLRSEYCINNFLDSMPMSADKIRATCDLSASPLERLFPIIKYHFKWCKVRSIQNNTNLMFMLQKHAKLRGVYNFTYRENIAVNKEEYLTDETNPLNEEAETALRDFLQACKESTIENIIFIEYPHIVGDEETFQRQCRSNHVAEIIKEAGFDYINLNLMPEETKIDYVNDFHDTDHMLFSGQKKMSDYIATRIFSKYLDEPKKQSEQNRAEWDESAQLIQKYYNLTQSYMDSNSKKQSDYNRPRLYEDREVMRELRGMRGNEE